MDTIAVRHSTVNESGRRGPDAGRTRRAHVVNVKSVDDHVRNSLDGDLRASRNVYCYTSGIYGLEASHD